VDADHEHSRSAASFTYRSLYRRYDATADDYYTAEEREEFQRRIPRPPPTKGPRQRMQ
jgi:hypothetical protein